MISAAPVMEPTAATSIETIDRLTIRSRPPGSPLMHQNWEKLLFLHWPIDPALIRPLIPQRLSIDAFEGQAWISVTPFTLSGLRPVLLPPIPGLSSFYELNVRTYVHYQGVPGLWFFSLYASKTIPALGARLTFSLPYRKAEMERRESGNRMDYAMRRTGSHPAAFEAHWEVGDELSSPAVDSLEFFLIERYCLYAAQEERLFRCRVYHVPWLIRKAHVTSYCSNLLLAEGLPEANTPPMVHYGGDQNVEVWALAEL